MVKSISLLQVERDGRLSQAALRVIEAYRKHLNIEAAFVDCDVPEVDRGVYLESTAFRKRISECDEDADASASWSGEGAIARHMRIHAILEAAAESGDGRAYSALVNHNKAEKEAHGMMRQQAQDNRVAIQVNIDLGDGQMRTITGGSDE